MPADADPDKAVQGWRLVEDDAEYGTYWLHEDTGSTSFEAPNTITCGHVVRLVDPETGAFYYYDNVLKTSSWDPPEGFVTPLANTKHDRWTTLSLPNTEDSPIKALSNAEEKTSSPKPELAAFQEENIDQAPLLESIPSQKDLRQNALSQSDLGEDPPSPSSGRKITYRSDDDEAPCIEEKTHSTDRDPEGKEALCDNDHHESHSPKLTDERFDADADADAAHDNDTWQETKNDAEAKEEREEPSDESDEEDVDNEEDGNGLGDLPALTSSSDDRPLDRRSIVTLERMQTQMELRANEIKLAEIEYQRRLAEMDKSPKIVKVKLTQAQLARRQRLLAEERERLAEAKEASSMEERHEYLLAFYEDKSQHPSSAAKFGRFLGPSKRHYSVQVAQKTKQPQRRRERTSILRRRNVPSHAERPNTAPNLTKAKKVLKVKGIHTRSQSPETSAALLALRADLNQAMVQETGESFEDLREAMLDRLDPSRYKGDLHSKLTSPPKKYSRSPERQHESRDRRSVSPSQISQRATSAKESTLLLSNEVPNNDDATVDDDKDERQDLAAKLTESKEEEEEEGEDRNASQNAERQSENGARRQVTGRARRRAIVPELVLRQMFATIDISGDGFVDLREMKAALRGKSLIREFAKYSPGLNMLLREELCQVIFESIDVDDSGDVSLEEFVRVFGLFLNETEEERHRRIDFRRLFDAMDRNGDGSIDMFELRHALRNDKRIIDMLKCSPVLRVLLRASAYHRISSIYLQFDVDNSGTLEWPEFLKVCQLTFHNDAGE
ncbi:Calmodulin [Hondaea fermentalgiana]|uniref:Calmodulin n=1 Tax=Hondaea fermentalgiana TaxID=2315210 RepID=A0A2R5GJA7_9STRA|nr:Calmodulin [Hondaea fermentalgiana]|eukprot:GBG30967.1 Calmodulin [Hondaea fermentalgiana]